MEFSANVQSKDRANHRKTIELPPEIRKKFDVKDHVKIEIKKRGFESLEFFVNIQSKTVTEGRKLIELPPSIRDNYAIGENLKINIEKL
jgi:bifunctional DNA-binding transcriptional regulator/antitoxin component of YhaV-PrlF toxin-antitoxin module